MRAIFVVYVVVIVAGLVYFTALGLLGAVRCAATRLSLVFGALFLGTLVAQAFVGHADFNAAQLAHNSDPISLWRYVRSSDFGVDVLENWQSEYLQFSLFILGTVWLIQRGSPESKPPGQAGLESDEEQHVGGTPTRTRPCGHAWAAGVPACTPTRCCS